MIPTEVLSRILATQPVLDAIKREQAGPRATFDHLIIGQAVNGLVKSQTKGITLVNIEGQTVAMRLPRQVATGDTLKLSFAGHMPQPVFLLDSPETAAADAPQLSQTARMLSTLMQQVPERTPPTVAPLAPLLPQATASPATLAVALQTALVRSGLFYESHLANWAMGTDSLDGLLQEPQNRLLAEASRAEPGRIAPAAIPLATANLATDLAAESGNPMHTLLTQQLQVLESPQFAWRGELWPGHRLEWQIKQQADAPTDDSARPAAAEAEPRWESRLKLTLPQLGTLNILIKLDAQQNFSINLMPEQPGVAPILQQHQTQLAERLASAGCALSQLSVQSTAGQAHESS